MQTCSNSIYPKCMEKYDNSGALLISAVFGTVNTLITAWSSEARPFKRLSNHLFRSP